MTRKQEIKEIMVCEMCDAGELIPKDGDGEFYEDMGGHIIHFSNLDYHIEHYLQNLSESDRADLMKRIQI